MPTPTRTAPAWWARGLLFENCNCQVVCPGHVHFDQLCTHERCIGYWALRFDEGKIGGVDLTGVNALIAYDSPRHMLEGHWTERLIIDAAASPDQRRDIEAILTGRVGGPWAVLARFAGTWLATRYLPIRIEEHTTGRSVTIDGLLDATVEALRGRDREQPVTFENMFNQIHASSQVVATGRTSYDDGTIVVSTEGTHALWSRFDWSVSGD